MNLYPEGHWGNENHNKDFESHPFVWGDYVEDIRYFVPDHEGR